MASIVSHAAAGSSVRCWLIRHGKAMGAAPDDQARPLAKRGRSDAASMRSWMRAEHPQDLPEHWVASPARRTRETAELLAGRDVVLEPRLYGAWVGEFLAVMAATPPTVRCAAFVAHNPTVGTLFHVLSGRPGAPRPYPTLGTALFELADGWQHPERARLLDFVSPKTLL